MAGGPAGIGGKAVGIHIGDGGGIAHAIILLGAARARALTRVAVVEADFGDVDALPGHIELHEALLIGMSFLGPARFRHQRHLGLGFGLLLEEELELAVLTGWHEVEHELGLLRGKTGDEARGGIEPVGGVLALLLPGVERIARILRQDAVAGGGLERQREAVGGLGGVGLLLALGGDERTGRLRELVEQPRRGFTKVLAEFAEANDGILALGLLDPDLVRLHGRYHAEQGDYWRGKACIIANTYRAS